MYIVASEKLIDSAVSEMLLSISEQASDDKYKLEGGNADKKRGKKGKEKLSNVRLKTQEDNKMEI